MSCKDFGYFANIFLATVVLLLVWTISLLIPEVGLFPRSSDCDSSSGNLVSQSCPPNLHLGFGGCWIKVKWTPEVLEKQEQMSYLFQKSHLWKQSIKITKWTFSHFFASLSCRWLSTLFDTASCTAKLDLHLGFQAVSGLESDNKSVPQ